MRRLLPVFFLLLAGTLWCQQTTTTPSVADQDPATEMGKLKKNCPFHKFVPCLEVLFTGQPVHIAAGSIAPQNGFGAGLAFVGHATPADWRINWNADAVAASNGAWRAGLYAKIVDTRLPDIGIVKGTAGQNINNPTELPEQPVINLYAQAISLPKLAFFGLGPNTLTTGRTYFGMREVVFGVSAVKPFSYRIHPAIYGEINGRSVDIRSSTDQPSPSIETVYNATSAPGLNDQPFFVQLGEGARMRPVLFDDRMHLYYDLAYRQFIAAGNSQFSFQRVNVDLSHYFSLYRNQTRYVVARDPNGPDDCSLDPNAKPTQCEKAIPPKCDKASDPNCEKVVTRNLEGSLGIRAFTALSVTPGGNVVPFYFQPTLGGSDINGSNLLSSYQDYRFRAPNVFVLRESFEHTLGKWPVGFTLLADQGKVGLLRGDLGSNHWNHSFSTGLTLRAGGFPVLSLLFSWGGNEGTHTSATMGNSLLGGSSRPSLF